MTDEPAANLAWLSRTMAALTTIGLIVSPVVLVSAYLFPGRANGFLLNVDDLGGDLTAATPLAWRIAALACSLAGEAFTLWALWSLRSMLLLYAKGEVFSLRALSLMHTIAVALFAGVIVGFAMRAPITLLLSWPLGADHRHISLAFGSGDVVTLFEAGVVLVIARVMREAARLADENAKFV
ncbi:MAG: DUF2975 domain-containing protein [Rhizomicrobium sp.]